ncbi:AAA family ATPase [Rhodobium gokarnense]|uniref:AAA family ATPase n=1 Tax=Rhodobium gokarnense TaxID=364296 RepID=A0ABT3HH24_9HYPH|nr:AAA family ATPase [Rhodobium gokarnense]MCW2309702.1 hypothetical protein [Rhodobium gokarnense]
MSDINYVALIGPVAITFWGDPNKALSNDKELRWGTRGARVVDLTKGTWVDHSAAAGGGVLKLIEVEKGLGTSDAVRWLEEQGLVKREDPAAAAKASEKEIETTYDYVDEEGTFVCQVVRYRKPAEPRFRQRRKAKNGVWIWGLSDGTYGRFRRDGDWFKFSQKHADRYVETTEFGEVARFLYGLPEVVEAVALEQAVYLPEGEKDVDNLRAMGLVATCNIGGANKWQQSFTESLRGAHVVILPDNDEAGEKHVTLVGAALRDAVSSLRILRIPGLPDKGDVSDWIADGGTADAFLDMVDRLARPWKPAPPKSKFGGLLFQDLDRVKGEEYEFLIDDFLSRGDRSLVYGASKSGKSFLAIDMAMCVARGIEFFGKAVRKGGVIYQAGEGQKGVKKRLRAYRQHNEMSPDTPLDFVLMPATIDLYHRDGDVDGFIAECKAWAAVMNERLELVVIDTLSTATAGADENSGKDMSLVLSNCARISTELKAHVMLVHHMPKNGKSPRGHGSIFANIDNAIQVDRDEETGVRTAFVEKQKDGDDTARVKFELCAITIGRREMDDRAITSCVVVDKGTKDEAKAADRARSGVHLKGQRRQLYQALIDALAEQGIPTPPELKLPRSIHTVVRYAAWKDAFTRISFIDEGDEKKRDAAVRQAISREGREMHSRRLIGRHDNYVWITGKPVAGFANRSRDETSDKPDSTALDGEDPFATWPGDGGL